MHFEYISEESHFLASSFCLRRGSQTDLNWTTEDICELGCQAVTQGIMRLNLDFKVPAIGSETGLVVSHWAFVAIVVVRITSRFRSSVLFASPVKDRVLFNRQIGGK